MSEYGDHLGPRWSAQRLEELAADLRERLGIQDEWTFDVLQVTWRTAKLIGPTRGLELIPRPDEYMGDKDAWATSDPPRIEIKQSKYDEAKIINQSQDSWLRMSCFIHYSMKAGGSSDIRRAIRN